MPIQSDEQLLTTVRYIHQNPKEIGVSFDTYRWSSYKAYLYGEGSLTDIAFVAALFETVENFVQFHREEVVGKDEPRRIPESELIEEAKRILGDLSPFDIKGLEKKARNKYLLLLKQQGLTVRQIERLTGIGRNIIARAK